ncbi:MAG: glutamate--tRNA ligase [Bacteroidales bacterium]|nr:glutamate--tRNA ligase [Bacteroidales bacterium]
MNTKEVRVRFAPSPTGPLHIGGVRTALFNYLFAKKHNGTFILRIEDTDQNRYVKGAEDYIVNSLKWCNIKIDEGVGVGGKYAPYRQSERKDIYKKYAEQLINDGFAYYAFDTPDELEKMREKLKAEKSENQQYNFLSRTAMRNSLNLSQDEVEKLIESNTPHVIRLKVPENEKVEFTDLVHGKISFDSSLLDDKILFKSDGMPTYHLANVVDDYLMKISHVIRGSEWINSTPSHVLLYRFLGWENEMPEFAHMPLILKPNGKGKLSKRDGDALGFPVFPLEWTNPNTNEVSSGYRESGYFSDAFINILALLGWNPGTEQEIFSMKELTEIFSLDRIGKSGSRFDPEKAKWFNHQYLINKNNEELAFLYQEILKEKGIEVSDKLVIKVVDLIKERASFVSDFWKQSFFFFQKPTEYDPKVVKKKWKEDTSDTMKKILEVIENIEDFKSEIIEETVKNYIEKNELSFGKVLNPLRLCLVGSGKGPSLFHIAEIIGKEEVVERINNGIEKIKK